MLALRRVGFAGWVTLVAFAAGVAAIVAAATMQCDDAGLSYVLRESMYFGAPALCLVAFVWSVVRRRRGLIALAAVGIVVCGAGYMIAWITSVLCVVSRRMLDLAKKGHEWLTWAAVAAGVATVIAAWTAPCGDAGVSYDLRASLYGLAPILALAAGIWAAWRRKWWVAAVSVAALGVWAVGLMIAAISAALCNWTLF